MGNCVKKPYGKCFGSRKPDNSFHKRLIGSRVASGQQLQTSKCSYSSVEAGRYINERILDVSLDFNSLS